MFLCNTSSQSLSMKLKDTKNSYGSFVTIELNSFHRFIRFRFALTLIKLTDNRTMYDLWILTTKDQFKLNRKILNALHINTS